MLDRTALRAKTQATARASDAAGAIVVLSLDQDHQSRTLTRLGALIERGELPGVHVILVDQQEAPARRN